MARHSIPIDLLAHVLLDTANHLTTQRHQYSDFALLLPVLIRQLGHRREIQGPQPQPKDLNLGVV